MSVAIATILAQPLEWLGATRRQVARHEPLENEMSLMKVLAAAGKDLSHLGGWIQDGLKVAASIGTVLDPSLVPIITALEGIFNRMPSGGTTGASGTVSINAETLQQLITGATALIATGVVPVVPKTS